MKKIIILFFISFWMCTFSQLKKENAYKRLVDSAIVIKSKNLYYHYKDLNNKINNIYVLDENSSPVKLENVKTSIPLQTIDIRDLKNRKLLKKGINVWKIIPLLYENQLKITIIDFKVRYKNKIYYYDNGGGSIIIFEYSCEEEKWKLINEEHTGN